MAQTPTTNSDEQNSSEPKSKTEPTASKETTRDIYTKLASQNPRFKEAPKSGKGFVIGGVKP
jgi:hypothetical protein